MNSARPIAPADTVYGTLLAATTRYADRPFLHMPRSALGPDSANAVTLTYRDTTAAVEALRVGWQRAGYGCGHRVALLLENRLEFFLHFLALNALGVSVVPLHHELPLADVIYRLAHSESSALVTLPEHRALATAAVTRCPGVVLVEAGDTPRQARIHAASSLPAGGGLDVEATILYTSGTTGQPKGCLLTNEYFLELGDLYINQGGLAEVRPGRERLITPLPVSHMNAMVCSFMAMLMSGGCLIQLDRFHPASWWQSVRESNATIVHYLGVMPAILLGLPVAANDDFGSQVRFGFGAGVDPRHQSAFERRFRFPLIEGWAMTETGAGGCIIANREPRHVGARCFGRAPARLDYRIVDNEGSAVASGKPGELLVRAAGQNPRRGFFAGYYKDEAATREAWAGGWFHTGDIVRVDDAGNFYFVDRLKNIIRRSGENIAAAEVEGALLRDPAILNCAVAPVPDEVRGEEVMACILLKDGETPSDDCAAAIHERCGQLLAYYKTPGYIAFVNQLPLTPAAKLQRGLLKALCAELLAEGKAVDLRGRKRRPGVPQAHQ
jgi:acyl-CoA synthetase (AMP-forming)/AMP-acid ligase II